MDGWPLVGRAGLLAEAARLLAAGTGVALVGPTGSGKTALAAALAAGSPSATWLRPVAELKQVPLGSVALLLGDGAGGPAPDGALREFALGPAASALAARVADGVLVVDDAHHLDDASAGLVHQLVSASGLRTVLTAPSEVALPDAITRLWKDRLISRVEVEHLDQAAVAELLELVLGAAVDSALVDVVWTRTLGSPLFVRELVTSARDDGAIRLDGGRWRAVASLPTPPRISDLVRSRLRDLPDDVRGVFEMVAMTDAIPLDALETAVGSAAVAALEERRLVTVEGLDRPVVRPEHPFVAEIARELLAVSARRAILRRAAELLAPHCRTALDEARVLRWRLGGGAAVEAGDLAAGITAALGVGDVDLAARASETLYASAPTFANGLLRAQILLRTERHAVAAAVLDEVAPLALDDDDVVLLTQVQAQALAYGQGRLDDAGAALAGGRARVHPEPGTDGADRLAHIEGALLLYQGRPADALAMVEADTEPTDSDARIYGTLVRAIAQLLLGRFHSCLETCRHLDAQVDASARTDLLGDHHTAEVVRLLARVELGELTGVAEVGGQRWAEWSGEGRASPWSHWLAWVLGRGALLRGRASEAAAWFRSSEVSAGGGLPSMLEGWVTGSRAYAELLTGDPGLATELTRAADAGEPGPGDDGTDRARAWLAATEGRASDAVDILGTRTEDLAARQLLMFEATLRHDVIRLGVATPATVERLAELAAAVDGPLMAARLEHGRALAAGDPVALGTSAERFEGLGADLFAAEAASQGVELARRRTEDRRASALLVIAERCRARCTAVDTPSLAAAACGPAPLTPREREIAARAAAGESSKDIACQLGLSRRTVDNTLQRVFIKLGVARRADLAGRLPR